MDEQTGNEQIGNEQIEPAGDAVCWLGLLCPECGAMPEEGGSQSPDAPCWRCGAVRAADADDADNASASADDADVDAPSAAEDPGRD
jgi:hypothetical protein